MAKRLSASPSYSDTCFSYLQSAFEWLQQLLTEYTQSEESPPPSTPKKAKGSDRSYTPAFLSLSQTLQLSEFEQNILLLCLAYDLNPVFAHLYAKAQQDDHSPYPTFALAFSLFDNPTWEAITPESPLRYWGLIDVDTSRGQSLMTCPLKVDERIIHYVHGHHRIDQRLLSLLFPLSLEARDRRRENEDIPDKLSPECLLAPSQQKITEQILIALKNRLQKAEGELNGNSNTNPISTRSLPLIQLLGANVTTKQIIAQQVCQNLGVTPYRLLVEQIPTEPQKLDSFIRLWQRESLLFPLALYIDIKSLETEAANTPIVTALQRFFFSCRGLFFLDSLETCPGIEGNKLSFDVAKPTPEEQYQTWCDILGANNEITAQQLTSQFNLNLTDILEVCQQNQELAPNNDHNSRLPDRSQPSTRLSFEGEKFLMGVQTPSKNPPSASCLLPPAFIDLWQGCLAHTRPQMEKLAQRLELKATWNDLILPEDIKGQLKQIVAQIRHRHQVYDEWGYRARLNRGLGVSTVFAGDSGTGKTMAAEVIANDLQLNLYRIDLSAVVSKYIGETEKNLRRLFDAAEDGGAILFFDEADALFGKRSEVKDSHDRHANIEINYLLQRLESYSGLAILATNKKASIDVAFLRRLRFIINFPFPIAAIRLQLWKKIFPASAPINNLDYRYLKEINLSGGSIQNVALNASFLAAENGSKIGMEEVMTAIHSEFLKLERSLNELNISRSIKDEFMDDEDENFN